MRIVITGGGTGGHIYPALAVAEVLKTDPATEKLLYIGNSTSLESEMIPRHGIDFAGIRFYGMPRQLSPLLPIKLLQWAWILRTAVNQAERFMRAIQPDVVFGTGGYVSAPVLMAARRLKVPYVIHEPDAHPGLVNRLMARHAAQVTAAFADAHSLLKLNAGKTPFQVTGNPIRGEIGRLGKAEALWKLELSHWNAEKPVLLVMGGSQGARQLNRALVEALPTLLDELGLQVIHQTGQKLYDETLSLLGEPLRQHTAYCVQPYYADMSAVWGAADLALCRSGSLTLSELYLSGTPSILVPYPFAAADHQRKNALTSVSAGASLMIPDVECTAEKMVPVLRSLLSKPERVAAMGEAALALAHPHATEEIVAVLRAVAERKNPSGSTK